MPIIRTEKKDNFTVISNKGLKDRDLSLRSKGLWALMLSYPDDWVFTIEQLTETSTDGRDSIKASIRELQENGYVEVVQERDHGKFLYSYTVYDSPQRLNRNGETATVKPIQLNTNKLNTNKPNTNKQIYMRSDKDIVPEFESFWDAYPKKRNKPDAIKVWRKMKPPLDEVLSSIEKYKQSSEWTKDNGQYIPYPATWLRGRRWEDEVEQKYTPKKDYGKGASHF